MPSAVTTTRAAEARHTAPVSTVDATAFRNAMGSFPTGVTVVTVATDDGNTHGITVNSFSSVSLNPMLVLVCLNDTSRGVGLIEHAGAFVVNVLSAGQQDVSRWFANRYRPGGSTMFDGMPFEPGLTGCPVLVEATASFDCRLRQSDRAGDHVIVLGEVVALVHRPQLEPLIFHAGSYKSLEHEDPPAGATAAAPEHAADLGLGAAGDPYSGCVWQPDEAQAHHAGAPVQHDARSSGSGHPNC